MKPYITTFPSRGHMRRLPWHVAVRADRKAVLTALGVALGVTFSVISFAVPSALQTATVSQEGPYANAEALITSPTSAPFPLADLDIPNATGAMVGEGITDATTNVQLIAFEGPGGVQVGVGQTRPAPHAPLLPAAFSIGNVTFVRGDKVTDGHVAPTWVVISPQDFRALDPGLPAGYVDYAFAPRLSQADLLGLEARGYHVGAAPGIEPFFQSSGAEVARDLILVVAFSSVLVGLFAYEFLRSEVREKRREIGLWRSLGMRGTDVVALLLARALAIVSAGMLLGAALAALTLAFARRVTGSLVFEAHFGVGTVLGLVAAFLIAGLVGGFVPARSAARSEIREQLEAAT